MHHVWCCKFDQRTVLVVHTAPMLIADLMMEQRLIAWTQSCGARAFPGPLQFSAEQPGWKHSALSKAFARLGQRVPWGAHSPAPDDVADVRSSESPPFNNR